MNSKHIGYALYCLAALAAVFFSVFNGSKLFRTEDPGSFKGKTLRCAIQLTHPSRHLPGLTFGHNYELLQRFASSLGDTLLPVVNPLPGESWIDSLKLGRADIVILPWSDSMHVDSVRFSRPIDSLTVWAVREESRAGIEEIDSWLDSITVAEGYESRRDAFTLRYSPSRRAEWGRKVSVISPYDSLIRAGAKSIGWDWRLLCALIYQESQFHIELRSRRGAEGLMQMMPRTAAKMGVEDLLDPGKSLDAGVSYIKHIQGMFRGKAADADELLKFTLAAYNAGEGRILDCINYAASLGADATRWDAVASVIPHLKDESTIQVDSIVRLGTFQGGDETIGYVEKVLGLFEDFKAIRP